MLLAFFAYLFRYYIYYIILYFIRIYFCPLLVIRQRFIVYYLFSCQSFYSILAIHIYLILID